MSLIKGSDCFQIQKFLFFPRGAGKIEIYTLMHLQHKHTSHLFTLKVLTSKYPRDSGTLVFHE